MITDKQRQRDYEYEADYQSKSRYTSEQWGNILSSGQIAEEDLALLKEIYASFNHAATLVQLAFAHHESPEDILERLNAIGSLLGEANALNPEVDYEGQEYWWYLFFWGKNLDPQTLELKMHPELTEAIGALYPNLEEAYYAFVSDVDRSLQIRYSQEDAVWIAASVLLYEKYYLNPGISADDILLMQYEVQTRSQKVYGQDVNTNTITQICNADERGHRFNYLRDIYKYYRVSYPGEFDGDRERPEEDNVNYDAYIYSVFGYMKLSALTDFIDHEYAHLVDESYVELTNANGFVRLSAFLNRQGGKAFSMDDTSEQGLGIRADGEDALETFQKIGEALLKEYPNFVYARKAAWYLADAGTIAVTFQDDLHIESYSAKRAFLRIATVPNAENTDIEIALHLPVIDDEEVMLDIEEKCNMLTLMTAAPFRVETVPAEDTDQFPSDRKLKASVLHHYEDFKAMSEEDIVGLFGTSMEIFASYYTDLCQNYYPAAEASELKNAEKPEDPLAAALGEKLTYRPAADVPGPQIIYREGATSPTTEFVTKALQSYGTTETAQAAENTASEEIITSSFVKKDLLAEEEDIPLKRHTFSRADDEEGAAGASASPQAQTAPASAQTAAATAPTAATATPEAQGTLGNAFALPASPLPPLKNEPLCEHPDRKDQSFHLYPKNTLIKGPVKTGKFHEAILTAVGIIEGKDTNMMRIEPVPDILEHYKDYVEEGRILHVSYPDIAEDGYAGFIERMRGAFVENGILKDFANHCGAGRFVVLLEEVDMPWTHLLGECAVLLRENRREGTSSETAVTLPLSKECFRLPSNLYLVATCDSFVCESTILEAIDHDFFIRPVTPNPEVLRGMRVEGISLQRLMTTLNMRISYFLGADYQLGEGFFLASPDRDRFVSLARVFREQLIPLLEKWFDGDFEQIRYVLGDNAKTRTDSIFYQEIPFNDRLFKGEIPDAFDRGRCIYRCNEDAFYNPASYIGIYE